MFELFATPLGILMRWIYNLVPNYFVALVLFTVLVRLVLFPLSIKNQKSQMDRARLAPRLERLQKKYGQDRQKMMQKQQELYEKEGVKMTGGCLPMLLQMLVLFSVIAVIYKPLTYIQSIPEQDINACVSVVDPKYNTDEANPEYAGYYRELNLFKAIEKDAALEEKMELAIVNKQLEVSKKETLTQLIDKAVGEQRAAEKALAKKENKDFDEKAFDEKFDKEQKPAIVEKVTTNFYKENEARLGDADRTLETIKKVGREFSIAGISLLEQPSKDGLKPNWLWLIAIASGLSAFFSGRLSMKYSKASMSAEQQQMGGCSTGMMTWMMPLMSLVFSFTVPAGVAVYWVFSNLLAMVQTVVLNKMYNPAKARAQAEAEYAERRRRKKEEKERLRQIHLAEQAAWQKEENEKRAQAKGDITKKKKATTTATPADLPEDSKEEVVETESAEEEHVNE